VQACGTDEVLPEEELEELEADQLKQDLDERAKSVRHAFRAASCVLCCACCTCCAMRAVLFAPHGQLVGVFV
jgi:hypothetical protein